MTVSVSVPVAGKTTKSTCAPAPLVEHTMYTDNCTKLGNGVVEVCATVDAHVP